MSALRLDKNEPTTATTSSKDAPSAAATLVILLLLMATFCALLVLLLFSIDDRDYRTGHRTALDVVVPQCATTPTAPGAGAQRPQP